MSKKQTASPLISIVIPVYNGSNYLREAIDSALRQTYKNIEVLVINDGSNDNGATARIAKSYGKKIRYFEKPNGGVATALNMGIQKMRGEYFSWLSHDDLYRKNKIATQVNYMQKHPQFSGAILYSDFATVDKNKKIIERVKIKNIAPEDVFYQLFVTHPIHGCSLLIPKNCFPSRNPFNPKLRATQDYDLWFRMAKRHLFVRIPKSLILSRIHAEQDTLKLTKIVLKENNQLYKKYIRQIHSVYNDRSVEELKAILFKCVAGLINKNFHSAAHAALQELLSTKTVSSKEKVYYIIKTKLLRLSFYRKAIFSRATNLLRFGNKLRAGGKGQKNILMISPCFYPIPGGLAGQTHLLARSFVKKGYSVDVLTEQLKPSLLLREEIDGASVFRIKHIKKRGALGLIRLGCAIFTFVVKNRDYKFCIIRGVSSHAIIVGLLKSLKIFNVKTFITAETGDKDSEITELAQKRFARLFYYFLKKHDFINSNNHYHYKQYQQYGFARNKLTIIHNGVDISDYATSKYPAHIDKFLFLSELNKEKGIRELLKAFKMLHGKYPQKKLIIGGFGKESKYIADYIKKNNLANVVNFVGFVKREAKKEFFASGDCFVFPSYSEGYGIVVAEAAIYKKCIISTNVADINKIYGKRIIYCNKRDYLDLHNAMERAIKTYDWRKLNYDQIIKKIDINNTAKKIEKLFFDSHSI